MSGSERGLEGLLESRRANAALAWALTGFVALVAVEGFLTGDLLWAAFPLAVAALALVPPLTYRTPTTMLPWEVLALCSLPVLGRALATDVLLSDVSTYLSVAALALVVAVLLDVFTPVRMPPWFAVVFVTIATLATAGVWAVVQWAADVALGTAFIYPEPVARPAYVRDGGFLDGLRWLGEVFLRGGDGLVSAAAEHAAHDALMWDFVAAAVAGVLAGVVFEAYFRRLARGRERLPEEVQEVVEDAGA
jgi:hypothetical protein